MSAPGRMLRWYPAAWRQRYGDELLALMEDTYGGGGRMPWRSRLGIVRAGLGEHLHRLDTSEPGPPGELRGGSFLVLCGWAFFVVGGAAYAKLSEHWDQATPPGLRHLPAIGYNATVGAAVFGLVIVAVGAALVLPSFVSLLRTEGWPAIRRPITRATVVVAATVALSLVVAFSHRGGRAPAILPVGWLWAALVSLSIAMLTAAAVSVARRLELSPRVLASEGWLALGLTLVMGILLAGTALWWAAITGSTAILSGSRSGLFSTPGSASMATAAALMVVGMAVALAGSVRIVRSQRALRTPHA